MEEKIYWQNWYLGRLHSGIGQGYFQSTPLQLIILMTAQIANGGFKIKPRIVFDEKNDNLRNYLKYKNENPNEPFQLTTSVEFRFATFIQKSRTYKFD